jgi:hypothetical protein
VLLSCAVKLISLAESCRKTATFRGRRFFQLVALMPSAGTNSIWKSTLVRDTGAIGADILRMLCLLHSPERNAMKLPHRLAIKTRISVTCGILLAATGFTQLALADCPLRDQEGQQCVQVIDQAATAADDVAGERIKDIGARIPQNNLLARPAGAFF